MKTGSGAHMREMWGANSVQTSNGSKRVQRDSEMAQWVKTHAANQARQHEFYLQNPYGGRIQ